MILCKVFFVILILSFPFISRAQLINTENLLTPIKQNLQIGTATPPGSQQIIDKNAPQLRELNQKVKTNIGVDLGKLIGWLAQFLQRVFQFIVTLLNALSRALSS